MVHYAGYTPRFHPSDFHTYSLDGVGADWPIGYDDLRPYYAGPRSRNSRCPGSPGRGATRTATRITPNPSGATARSSFGGAAAAGIEARVGPVAIANGRFGNRDHCIYRGFCLQGCKVNAKASPLITHVPDALAHGAEVRANCMVTQVVLDGDGRAGGVIYVRDGVEHFQRARLVAVAGYSIETPRLLLLSACDRFPDGLCNDFGQVGRYVMVQGAPQTAGRFADEVRMYKALRRRSPRSSSTRPTRPSRTGGAIRSRTCRRCPITYAEHVAAQGHWGSVLREYMRDYVHWATVGALCEFLPRYDNHVSLAERTDRHGLPVARFSYSQCDNDRALMKAAQATMETILRAAGAEEVITIDRYAHLVGGCRMAADEQAGVVDGDLRTFAVPNLYITDGSVLPTQGAANPALTIMALAARCAERLVSGARAGLSPAGSRTDRWAAGRSTGSPPRSTRSPPISPRPTARSPGRRPPWWWPASRAVRGRARMDLRRSRGQDRH